MNRDNDREIIVLALVAVLLAVVVGAGVDWDSVRCETPDLPRLPAWSTGPTPTLRMDDEASEQTPDAGQDRPAGNDHQEG